MGLKMIRFAATLVLTILVSFPVIISAATVTVNSTANNTPSDDDICTLREAINNANSDSDTTLGDCLAGSGVDTISFSVSGTITLDSQLPDITDTDALTIDGTGQSIIISGNEIVRPIFVANGASLNLNKVTILDGDGDTDGGGEGGGIYNRGTLRVTNSTLTRNHAQLLGGGILNGGTLTVTNSYFDLNDVGFSGGGGLGGGAIYNGGVLTVTNSTFYGNTALYGGAGGAIFNGGQVTMTVTNSTFYNNSALSGAGIYNASGGLTLTVTNSTFYNNAPDFGEGFQGCITNSAGSTLNMSNTIIARSFGTDCSNLGTIATHVNNLIEDGSCSPDFEGDPLIVGFGDFGGPTMTMPLGVDSPAIDKGDNTTCANAAVNNLDQRGFLRPIDGDAVPGAVCDIGAFEDGSTAIASVSILLMIDADTINNGIKSIQNISSKSPFCGDGSSSVCVNDDIADPGVREILFTRGNDITPYTGLVLTTGKKGDEGLFQFTNPDLQISQQNGATFTIQEFIFAQGAAANENNLDKVSGVRALTAAQILELEGQTVCAVVYDSDISVDRSAGFASLKGSTLGITAFTVTAVTPVSKALPKITVDLLDSSEVLPTCEAVLPPSVPATASITINALLN